MAKKHVRWGFNKMYQTIRNQGYICNHKKVRRIYCELGLNLRKKPKKRLPSREPKSLSDSPKPNYCWSMDFMSDALTTGDKFRTFNVIDDFNREVLGILVGKSLPSNCITHYLDFIAHFRGYPMRVRVDNAPEFISRKFVSWAIKHDVVIDYIQPGKPSQNAYIERFNRTYREEVLDIYLFESIAIVQKITDKWLSEYNQKRPHESLNNLPPTEFLKIFCSLEGMPSREQEGVVVKQ